VVGIVGPRLGFKDSDGQEAIVNAWRIEYGHGGPQPAPAHPYLRPAWDETRAAAYKAMADALAAALEAEARR
jgi:hypothetical protein